MLRLCLQTNWSIITPLGFQSHINDSHVTATAVLSSGRLSLEWTAIIATGYDKHVSPWRCGRISRYLAAEAEGYVIWWRHVAMATWNSLHNSLLAANHIDNETDMIGKLYALLNKTFSNFHFETQNCVLPIYFLFACLYRIICRRNRNWY